MTVVAIGFQCDGCGTRWMAPEPWPLVTTAWPEAIKEAGWHRFGDRSLCKDCSVVATRRRIIDDTIRALDGWEYDGYACQRVGDTQIGVYRGKEAVLIADVLSEPGKIMLPSGDFVRIQWSENIATNGDALMMLLLPYAEEL